MLFPAHLVQKSTILLRLVTIMAEVIKINN